MSKSLKRIDAQTASSARWKPKLWTLSEYLALPEADKDTGACPNCSGRHFGAVNATQKAPPVYRCHGTEAPNMGGYPYRTPCDTLFRGRPGDHFAADYYAEFFTRAVEPEASGATKDQSESELSGGGGHG